MFGAEFFGEFEARREEVGGQDVDAAQLQESGEHEADGALADHEHIVAAQKVQPFNRLEDGVHRFEHGTFFKRIFGGNLHDAGQDEVHDAHVFGEAAAGGLKAGGDAGAFITFALGKGAVAAVMAFQARHMMVESHAVADLEAADDVAGAARLHSASARWTNFYNCSSGFVSEDARGFDGAVVDFFDVGGANAADGDFDEQFVWPNGRHRDGFDAEIVDAAINDGTHGFRDDKHGQMLTANAAE